ncbi:sulfotransferase 1A3-like isoform X2 [Pomacea canaliculata]|nr:sulfotransferase 1A3-like isoform X2 [Pomacea canaliculata]XP_025092422.1 sulfotransferase 1A3-like isoform X2 [Pomacea canaliculata]XP_025092424.1 sulfotransferase 1A3-like isoform X2 [Pomacea canaliculata]XP_025092425.1 sulfotransferase 1A3-like isoform X2 [Pomacea canaliculata]
MESSANRQVDFTVDHSKVKPAEFEGQFFPETCDEPVGSRMRKIKDLEIRPADVMLCSYPKSGTHWVYRMMDMLLHGAAEYRREAAPEHTFLDMQRIQNLPHVPSPRILITHLPFGRLPRQVEDKRTKIVYVYRNPKAVLVSFYFQMKDSTVFERSGMKDMTVDRFAELFLSPQVLFGGLFNHWDEVATFQSDHPDVPVFRISYEEMSLNPTESVERLAVFLGVACSKELCREIAQSCDFRQQKETEETLDAMNKELKFYRKGDMNDWKNHLTVAISERLDAIVRERADHCLFSAKYAS